MPEIFDASKKKKTVKSGKAASHSLKRASTKNSGKKTEKAVVEEALLGLPIQALTEQQVPEEPQTRSDARMVIEDSSELDPTDPERSNEPLTNGGEEIPVDEAVDTSKAGPSRNVNDYSEVMAHLRPSHNPFHAFAAKPTRTSFDTQHHEEEILLLLRQHPITQVKWVVITIILLLLPWLFTFVGVLNFLPPTFQFIASLGWYLLIFGFALEAFLSWFYNVYIITDERVIDVDFESLLFKNISSAKIEKIEDVSAATKGTLGAIFDYGDVQIQTAGAQVEFDFKSVPFPSRVTAFLNELIVEEERERIEGRVN